MSKLFVGGLNFQTGAETLGKLFETVGTVKAATIITNDGVSLGRGTVEMETEEAAQQAINKLNGCELEGRRIRVEFEGRPTTRGRGRGRGRGGFSGRGSGGFRGRGGGGGFAPRGRFGGRWGGGGGGGGFGRNIGYGGYGGFSVGFGRGRGGYRVGGGFGGFNARPFRRFGGEGFRGRGRGRGRGRFGGRGGRFRTPFDPNTPLSKTRVYINNLPFNLNDEGLQKVFTEKGLHVKEVSLGKRRFSTDRNVGFGFVEFETEEEQQRVLREFVNIDIDGRPCTIFAARPPPPKENQESTSGWSR